MKHINNNKGFIVILATTIVLAAGLVILLSTSYINFNSLRIIRNDVDAIKSYYIAEGGIEDSLLRLNKEMNFSKNNSLTVGGGTATIEIGDPIGGSRFITSSGNLSGRIRKVRAIYTVITDNVSFHYGTQVGDGGMEMGNNSRVKGNVFSNGSVIGSGGKGYIDNNIIVAHNGNKISGLGIGGDALVYTCEDSTINGNLTYVSGGHLDDCSVKGTTKTQTNAIEPQNLPISDSQINEWKNKATNGGILYNNVSIDGAESSLGPIQIGTLVTPKNLTVTNGATLKVNGTIYVTGDVSFSNNAIIELDNSYGSLSGIIIADGKITTGNNAILRGSGVSGSYILILSTNDSLNPDSPAISVNNNAAGAIFYSNSGLIYLSNNMNAREVTGYKIKINNGAEIQYESGLQNAMFSNGPGGSWQVTEWKEIE